jgi:hypothetical protein
LPKTREKIEIPGNDKRRRQIKAKNLLKKTTMGHEIECFPLTPEPYIVDFRPPSVEPPDSPEVLMALMV